MKDAQEEMKLEMKIEQEQMKIDMRRAPARGGS